MDLSEYFDRVVVINLRRRPDRLAHFWGQLETQGWPFVKPQVFMAVDGSLVPTPDGWEGGGGAWACRQSHLRILEDAMHEGVRHLLVLEDDLSLPSGFSEKVAAFLAAVPEDFDGLMLGGQHHRAPRKVTPGVVRCLNAQRTHAYSVRGKYLSDLYALWASPNQKTHIDHAMGPFQARYRIYAPEPFLCGQARSKSDISGVVNPSKFWNPPTGQEPVVVLHCPRDVAEALSDHGFHRGYDRDEDGIDRGLKKVFRGELSMSHWVNELQWECVSEEGFLCTLWHPEATVDRVRACWTGPVWEVRGQSVEEALASLPERSKLDEPISEPMIRSSKPRLVLLHAPPEVANSLPWHRGYWRDPVTDVDNGLRHWGETNDLAELREVVRVLLSESSMLGTPACLWFPERLNASDVARATTVPFVEIRADTAAEAMSQLQGRAIG